MPMPKKKTPALDEANIATVRELLTLGCLRLGVALQQNGAAAIDDVTTELARLANLRDALPVPTES
jgi:hypothetical protein